MAERKQGIPVIEPLLALIIGTRNDRFVKKYNAKVDATNALEAETRKLTDAQLRARADEFRKRLKEGETPEDLMPEAFATAREAMDRSIGIRSVFDPRFNFDPSALNPAMRDLYHSIKKKADELPPVYAITAGQPPEGAIADESHQFRGESAPVPGWRRVEIPPEFYDAVREIYPESKPPFRARPFDVQLIGAMVLYQGKIAEMKTGEGKTIVAPLAAALVSYQGKKVHVVTVNDYLVQRDRDWTAPFFHAMGLTVGSIHPMHMQPEGVKREMYRSDIVYGTTSEFGFDYLRDNMKRTVSQQVQRRRDFAIVDEVDSILIDEARTPLLISGPAFEETPRYDLADSLARHLVAVQSPWNSCNDRADACKRRIKGLEGDIRNAREKEKIPDLQKQLAAAKDELPSLEEERDTHTQYYEVKEDRKQVHLTHDGVAEAQKKAGIGSFYVDQNMDIPHLLENSLRAHTVYQRDKDYVVMEIADQMTGRPTPSIVIVDIFTGRPMIGRQWSDGLHQAIECKERVPIKQETQTIATITIQNFFKMYSRLAGMTGTADTEAQEFHDIYSLDVVSIPTNKEVRRLDFDDRMYLTAKDKWSAIVDEIKSFHDVGRPILVGTTSVERSETLSQMLTKRHQVKHEVLNAKQHQREANIIESAGQLGAVMIATNMAGRGTDIKLGRYTRKDLLEHWLRRGIAPRTATEEDTDESLREKIFRKIAPTELNMNKREADEMPFADLELALLRHWATTHTWMGEGRIAKAPAQELRDELDKNGRFIIHNIRWFSGIEDMGGLHVIGTERHDARRIDNQLRGRSGRQGDKGSSRFFVSIEDDLMRMFAGEKTMKILSALGMKEGDAIDNPMLSRSITNAQKKVEEVNFQRRKNLMEMDEVMEFQRQDFYGLRQRVLEGRDVRGLVRELMTDAVRDAADEYLARDYPSQCAAEFAKQRLECSILPDRLKGKHKEDIDGLIRKEAKDDARQMIRITIGEYMPMEGSEVSVEFDSAGLISWARERFRVELHSAELREGGPEVRRKVEDQLYEAAAQKIEEADLTGVEGFFAPDYGARELSKWAEQKFGVPVDPAEIMKTLDDPARRPEEFIMDEVLKLYQKREVEYPVNFQLSIARIQAQQQGVDAAMGAMCRWANTRYEAGWEPDSLKRKSPNIVREDLLAMSQKFAESGRLEREIEEAIAIKDDDALVAHFKSRFGVEGALPEWMQGRSGEERTQAIQGRVEGILRSEMLYFEQNVLLDIFDNTWRDHLYAMDQMRDSISFRGFAQQDYRIEFKKEGSKLFTQMKRTIRERVASIMLKAELSPRAAVGGPQPPPPRPPAPAPLGMGTITGPGIG